MDLDAPQGSRQAIDLRILNADTFEPLHINGVVDVIKNIKFGKAYLIGHCQRGRGRDPQGDLFGLRQRLMVFECHVRASRAVVWGCQGADKKSSKNGTFVKLY